MDVKVLQKMYDKVCLDYKKYKVRTQRIIKDVIKYVDPEIK